MRYILNCVKYCNAMLIYKLYKNQKSFQFKAIYRKSQIRSNFRNSRTTYIKA